MAVRLRLKSLWPALVALVVSAAYVGWRLWANNGDPVQLNFTYFDILYDGVFVYRIARNPDPQFVGALLDDPAYRYQRILYPLLVRLFSLGRVDWIPWVMIGVNLVVHTLATWALAAWLRMREVWAGYALIYGLWVGIVSAVGLNMNEALAYGLVVAAWWARGRRQWVVSSIMVSLALFAKEPTLPFWAALLLAELVERKHRASIATLLLGGVAFVLWQLWLSQTFGEVGVSSGTEQASLSFEIIPFMGLWRVGMQSLPALGLYLAIFGPTIVLPTIWAEVASIIEIMRGDWGAEVFALLFNGLVIVTLPFSTFREPLALVRLASGLVLATVFFAVVQRLKRPLRYGMMWTALLVLLQGRG